MAKYRSKQSKLAKVGMGIPKGAYRLPTGGYAVAGAWFKYVGQRGQRRIRIVGVRRDSPDEHKIARVLMEIARRMERDVSGS